MRLSTFRIQPIGSRVDDSRRRGGDMNLYVETETESDLTSMHVVGFSGRIVFYPSKPDGRPRKLLDVSRLAALGWRARATLRDGIAMDNAHSIRQQ